MPGTKENKVKTKLREGQVATVLGGLNTPEIIDYMGRLGFDGAWRETEYGTITWDQVAHRSRACDLWNMTSVCRVHHHEPWLMTRTLDVGATGRVVPHGSTKAAAKQAATSAQYGPRGSRGMAAGRQSSGVTDSDRKAHAETLVVVLIEEIKAVGNLPDILTIDQIDVFFVAPSDLAQTMGYTGQPTHPEVFTVVDRCIAHIVAAGQVPGHIGNAATVESDMEKGVRFFLTSWQPWLARGANDSLSKVAAKVG